MAESSRKTHDSANPAHASVSIAEAKAEFASLIDRVEKEHTPITIMRRGVPVAQVVPLSEAEMPGRSGSMEGAGRGLGDIIGLRAENGRSMTNGRSASSKESLLLDTHIWFRLQANPRSLKPAVVDAIDEAGRHAALVSVVLVWELAMLERARRIELAGGVERCQVASGPVGRLTLVTLEREILASAQSLHLNCLQA